MGRKINSFDRLPLKLLNMSSKEGTSLMRIFASSLSLEKGAL